VSTRIGNYVHVAVDIGGTFTDVVVLDDQDGRTYSGKALTTPVTCRMECSTA